MLGASGQISPSADERRRQAVLVRCGTLAGVAVAVMSAVAPALQQKLDVPLAGLALLGALLVNLTVYERTRAYRWAVVVLLGTTMSFTLVVVLYTRVQPATVLWAYVFQALPYFLTGRRIGVVIVVAFDAALLALMVTVGRASPLTSDRAFIGGFAASLIVLAAVSFLFEHVQKLSYDRLRVEVADRRRAEAEARKATEMAERTAAVQARFLANMSHEIRTPMNGILGVNELLLLSTLTAEQENYANTINASARGLLGILNDILDLSKIESGQFTLEQSAFDLRQLLTTLVALHDPDAKKKGLALSLDLSEDVPDIVTGDGLRLRQVLTNLLRNAVKFTSEGRIDLRVQKHDAKERLRFEVRDTGIGLPPGQKKRIFDAFHQADASTTREYGGTGLGLSICKELVQLMGGQIGADGRPGLGSVFWFVIPLAEAEDARPEQSGPPLASVSSLLRHRRVLVVEDNAVNRMVVRRMLERLELTVETAEDGQVAVEMWKPGRYTMIFMDLQMPRLDGLDTTRSLRQLEDGREHTPIVALTANAMVGDRERCLAAGMDDYLSKPVVFNELKRVVEHWFGGPPKAGSDRTQVDGGMAGDEMPETVDQRPCAADRDAAAKLGA